MRLQFWLLGLQGGTCRKQGKGRREDQGGLVLCSLGSRDSVTLRSRRGTWLGRSGSEWRAVGVGGAGAPGQGRTGVALSSTAHPGKGSAGLFLPPDLRSGHREELLGRGSEPKGRLLRPWGRWAGVWRGPYDGGVLGTSPSRTYSSFLDKGGCEQPVPQSPPPPPPPVVVPGSVWRSPRPVPGLPETVLCLGVGVGVGAVCFGETEAEEGLGAWPEIPQEGQRRLSPRPGQPCRPSRPPLPSPAPSEPDKDSAVPGRTLKGPGGDGIPEDSMHDSPLLHFRAAWDFFP